jgi:hypothetical protein
MAENLAQEHWIETYKSLITLSLEAFRFSALANGGSAVALLAYLGNVAGVFIWVVTMRNSCFVWLFNSVAAIARNWKIQESYT